MMSFEVTPNKRKKIINGSSDCFGFTHLALALEVHLENRVVDCKEFPNLTELQQ